MDRLWPSRYPQQSPGSPFTDLQGLLHQEIEFQTHPGIGYAKTFRLQILQRFLSKVAATIGVNFIRAQYSGWCPGNTT